MHGVCLAPASCHATHTVGFAQMEEYTHGYGRLALFLHPHFRLRLDSEQMKQLKLSVRSL